MLQAFAEMIFPIMIGMSLFAFFLAGLNFPKFFSAIALCILVYPSLSTPSYAQQFPDGPLTGPRYFVNMSRGEGGDTSIHKGRIPRASYSWGSGNGQSNHALFDDPSFDFQNYNINAVLFGISYLSFLPSNQNSAFYVSARGNAARLSIIYLRHRTCRYLVFYSTSDLLECYRMPSPQILSGNEWSLRPPSMGNCQTDPAFCQGRLRVRQLSVRIVSVENAFGDQTPSFYLEERLELAILHPNTNEVLAVFNRDTVPQGTGWRSYLNPENWMRIGKVEQTEDLPPSAPNPCMNFDGTPMRYNRIFEFNQTGTEFERTGCRWVVDNCAMTFTVQPPAVNVNGVVRQSAPRTTSGFLCEVITENPATGEQCEGPDVFYTSNENQRVIANTRMGSASCEDPEQHHIQVILDDGTVPSNEDNVPGMPIFFEPENMNKMIPPGKEDHCDRIDCSNFQRVPTVTIEPDPCTVQEHFHPGNYYADGTCSQHYDRDWNYERQMFDPRRVWRWDDIPLKSTPMEEIPWQKIVGPSDLKPKEIQREQVTNPTFTPIFPRNVTVDISIVNGQRPDGSTGTGTGASPAPEAPETAPGFTSDQFDFDIEAEFDGVEFQEGWMFAEGNRFYTRVYPDPGAVLLQGFNEIYEEMPLISDLVSSFDISNHPGFSSSLNNQSYCISFPRIEALKMTAPAVCIEDNMFLILQILIIGTALLGARAIVFGG